MAQTVLVADDSQTIRKIVEMALKASSYQVVGVASAQDAMEAASHAPSVILLDYYMPDGSGYDVCRALKANASTSQIPVIMLGGTYKSFDEDRARQSGADGVVMKPFKTDTLLDAIEAVKNAGAQAPAATPTPPPAAPVHAAPPVQPEPPAPAPPVQPVQPAPPPQRAAPVATPQPVAAEPVAAAPPRTPTPAPAGGSQPQMDVNASSRTPAAPPAPTAGSGPIGVSRGEIEKMIRDEVRATVKADLPAMLRSVMGETFQKKVLPKLINHTEQRVEKMVADRMQTAIREQVRVELERLLAE